MGKNENEKFCLQAPMHSGGQRQGHASHYHQALREVIHTNRNHGSGGGGRAQATTDRKAHCCAAPTCIAGTHNRSCRGLPLLTPAIASGTRGGANKGKAGNQFTVASGGREHTKSAKNLRPQIYQSGKGQYHLEEGKHFQSVLSAQRREMAGATPLHYY